MYLRYPNNEMVVNENSSCHFEPNASYNEAIEFRKWLVENSKTINDLPLWPPRSPEFLEGELSGWVHEYVDSEAINKGYRGALSVISYNQGTNAKWKAEAQAFALWRQDVWEYAIPQIELIKNGSRPEPTRDEFIAELPSMNWPGV